VTRPPHDAARHAAAPGAARAERFDLVRAAVRNRQVVYVLLSLLVVLGLTSLVTMPRREDPRITIRQGLVLALYPGATAEQVEQQVARRVERRLFARAEVKKAKTYTTSRPGLFVANVELEDRVRQPAEFWAMLRHDLNEAAALDLPPGVVGPIVDADFGDVAAMLLTVRAPDGRYGPRELRTFLDRVEDAVRAVPATAKVRRWGEQEEELAVTIRPERLAQYGLTPAQVLGALRARNAVVSAGGVDAGSAALRLRPRGQFASEDEVRAVQLAGGPTGQPVRLGDVAAVTRRYVDATYAARVAGAPAVLMSIEMQEGRNIVAFGQDVGRALDRVRPLLPPDLEITRVADQPVQVRQRVLDFGREFTIAVLSVILVTVLLLPLRVATIAALAIPATVAVTVAALRALGVELHQISFAGLVVALGMVVDDAIVIADNYVELLDEGVTPADAAWRAASDLAAPVLGATLTIVASFLPLGLLLPGTVGEFIRALPYTVAVALLCSYGVAMFLTPLLCLAFIRTGLRPRLAGGLTGGGAAGAAPTRGALARLPAWLRAIRPLDVMERAYARVMAAAMPRQRLTLAIAASSVVAGAVLLGTRPQRFFPPAERPQFVVDVWLPEGTRFEATDAVVRRLAARLERTPGVAQVGAFVGGSAPRFYYNVEPEFNVPNFGQLLVNTTDMHDTPALQASLHAPLARLAPEATVLVKQLEQGPALKAPVEIRLAGDDLTTLRRLADSAARILAATPGSEYVRTDWHEDQPALALVLRRDVAARVGITEGDLAQHLAAGLDGVPATTLWEGGRRMDVRLRFDSASRRGPADVADTYVTSPTTGARLPLREVADVRADWQPSRIVRRNGVRTVSVLAFARPGLLASGVLAAARPRLDALALPPGYALTYGGETENQGEIQRPMGVALSVSLLGIFLILFVQFRTLRHSLVVMVSIPLALFGSALGLVLTGNPFGFTANLGLTALTGVVVRNAIILVDHALALRAAGVPLERAALDAGRRRLRPIFLTTMAAAVGVVPLIVSGSGLWSPLASVLAVGLVFSMVGTLVVVPILFVRAERAAGRKAERLAAAGAAPTAAPLPLAMSAQRRESPLGGPLAGAAGTRAGALVLALGGLLAASAGRAAAQTAPAASRPPVTLTLERAVALAVDRSRATRIAAARVAERTALSRAARADRLPRLEASGQWLGNTGTQRIAIPRGALGVDAVDRPMPNTDRVLAQDGRAAWFGLATASQPLTPLVRIGAGVRAADAAAGRAEAEREATARDVAFGAERLYLTALIADRRAAAARLTLAAREARDVDATRAVQTGLAVDADRAASRAGVLDARQAVVAAENAAEDARAELALLLAIDPDSPLALAEPDPAPRLTAPAPGVDDAPTPPGRHADASSARATPPRGPAPASGAVGAGVGVDAAGLDAWLRAAHAGSPEVRTARAQVAEAAAATDAARAAWIPDVALYGQLVRQSFTPVIGRRLWTGGVRVAWTAWDFGRRDHETEAAVARRRAAEENLGRVDDEVAVAVRRAWRAVVRAERLLDAATAAAAARAAAARITSERVGAGLARASARSEADAERVTAEADRYAAMLGVRIARAELRRLVGPSAP
jgi:multidrug efflux pump subunit AcrB/outer membrane protein TolC